jgi:hypothetical protein
MSQPFCVAPSRVGLAAASIGSKASFPTKMREPISEY